MASIKLLIFVYLNSKNFLLRVSTIAPGARSYQFLLLLNTLEVFFNKLLKNGTFPIGFVNDK